MAPGSGYINKVENPVCDLWFFHRWGQPWNSFHNAASHRLLVLGAENPWWPQTPWVIVLP